MCAEGRKTMAEEKFELVSNYAPTGDQPQAIAQLVEGVQRLIGKRFI